MKRLRVGARICSLRYAARRRRKASGAPDIRPATLALSIQLAALPAALAGGAGVSALTASAVPWLALAGLHGLIAASIAIAARMTWWWWPIHLLFAPAAALMAGAGVSPGWFLAGFVLLLGCYWNSFRSQVPLYLSNDDTAQAVLGLVAARNAHCVADLGCGTGGFLARLARARPHTRFIGFETAPLPWLIARWRTRALENCEVRLASFWGASAAEIDLAYAFLSPVPMARLWQKLRAEMPADALLVSNSFEVPDHAPDRVIEVGDARGSRLFCYRIPRRA